MPLEVLELVFRLGPMNVVMVSRLLILGLTVSVLVTSCRRWNIWSRRGVRLTA